MTVAEGELTAAAPRAGVWHADWLVRIEARTCAAEGSDSTRRWNGVATTLEVEGEAGSDLRIAEDTDRVVVFSGVLTNQRELDPKSDDAADVVRRLIAAQGDRAFVALRGSFAALVWHRASGTLQVVRDQVGLAPIYYAKTTRGWTLSPSPDRLVTEPGVSREADAVALSEWLCGWFPAIEDTAYRDVKRVPPASVLSLVGQEAQARQYWDPLPDRGSIEYVTESELEAVGPALVRAVERASSPGNPALFLSGGLDSIAVAVALSEVAAQPSPAPLALSLAFPEGAANERAIQVGVAERLGLRQQVVAFDEAVGPRGLIGEALALSATWPQPMWNVWTPAYLPLAAHAAADGRKVVLTGRGGDEWFTVSPYLLADQLKRGDIAGAWRLVQSRRRSNNLRGARAIARLVWLTAGRPLGSAAMDAIAPRTWHRRRRRRLLGERPDWVAPDPAIRAAMDERIDRWIDPARPAGGFYRRETRLALRHPAITHDMEETQEFGRRQGLRMLHPFWDVDLIELAYRIPPETLLRDGQSKWPLRRMVTSRLPGLGLERRGKVSAERVFGGLLGQQAPPILQQLQGPRALARIGVVGASVIEASRRLSPSDWGGPGRLWTLLNLETWVRQRA